MPDLILLTLPIVAGLIGWLTNALAVRMIFRPRHPRRLLGLTIQGLVPRRQAELARKIAETVEQQLISHRDIQEVLLSRSVQDEVLRVIENEVEGFLEAKLRGNPLLGMFLQGDMLASLKSSLFEQVQATVPGMLENLVLHVEKDLKFRSIIEARIVEFDVLRLERMILDIASRELKTIEVLGGVLGFFVGLAQLGLMYFAGALH